MVNIIDSTYAIDLANNKELGDEIKIIRKI